MVSKVAPRILLVLASAVGLAVAPKAEPKPKPVAIVVEHGPALPSGAVVRLRITVEPNPANREMWVAIEASGYAAASFEQLDGTSAPRTRIVEFKGVPDGEYSAYARVIAQHGEMSVSATFTVGAVEEAFQ